MPLILVVGIYTVRLVILCLLSLMTVSYCTVIFKTNPYLCYITVTCFNCRLFYPLYVYYMIQQDLLITLYSYKLLELLFISALQLSTYWYKLQCCLSIQFKTGQGKYINRMMLPLLGKSMLMKILMIFLKLYVGSYSYWDRLGSQLYGWIQVHNLYIQFNGRT